MAELTLKAPIASLTSPTNWYKTRDGLKTQITKVWNKYGSTIKKIAENTKVPANIILAFMMVESGGNPLAGGSDSATQGLMQFNRKYAGGSKQNTTLWTEYNNKRLTPEEKAILAKYGITFDKDGFTRTITQEDLVKPELNILIGSMILGQFIDQPWGKDPDGQIRMDRIIARYNWGKAGFEEKGIDKKNLTQIMSAVPSTTATYIKKMLGTNGALDIIKNDLSGTVK